MGSVASYASAMWPMQAFLLALIPGLMRASKFFAEGPVAELVNWLGESWVQCLYVALLVLAAGLHLWPTVAMIVKAGRAKKLRGTLMVAIFPAIAAAEFVVILLVTVWAAGYVAMAIRSMTL